MKNSSKRLKVIQPEKFIICKKILTLVLLINIQACYSAAVIDDFVENSLDKNLQIKPYTPSIINDEFAESNKKYSRIKPYEKLKPVDEELPKTVNKSTLTIMMIPFRISRFLFFPYVYADTALARTSEDNAIPTAIYGSIPRNVISIGLMTAAALIPAKPVPSPAPMPAIKQTMNATR